MSATTLAGCPETPPADGGDATVDAVAVDIGTRDTGNAEAGDATTLDVADVTVPNDVGTDVPVDMPVAPDVIAVDASDGGAACTLTRVLVTTTDFMNGGYVTGDLATRTLGAVTRPDGGSAPEQDHVARTSGCLVFDLWRTFSTAPNIVAVLDPANPYVPLRRITLDTVAGGPDGSMQSANPFDIAVISPTKAYVTQYNSAQVAIVNPTAGTRTGSFSLAAVSDADGIPEAAAILVAGSRAYIAIQELNRPAGYSAPAHSHVIVTDAVGDMIVDADATMAGPQGIELTFGNPIGMRTSADGRYILVTSTGGFGAGNGGIDVIDTTTNRVVRSVTASALGGNPSSAEYVTGTTAWASVSRAVADAGTNHVILAFDTVTGAITTTPIAQSSTVEYGGLRRAPDGTMWAVDSGFGLAGSVIAFASSGTVLTTFPTPGTNTYSLDFVP